MTTPPVHQLVPVELTQAQKDAGVHEVCSLFRGDGGWCGSEAALKFVVRVHRALLVAAPQPPAPAPAEPMLRADQVKHVFDNAWRIGACNSRELMKHLMSEIAVLLPPEHRAAFVERAGG